MTDSWAYSVPSTPGVHNQPPSSAQWQNLTQEELNQLRSKLVESILQVVVQDVTGALLPGPAGEQLASWAITLLNDTSSIAATAITGVMTLAQLPISLLTDASAIAASAITGVLSIVNIPGLDAAKIVSGVLDGSLIPNLAASIITSGSFSAARIPGLDASKLISGVLDGSLIPNLAASIINSGVFTTGRIPGLDASKIVSGVLDGSLIPNLNASIINAGTFVQSLIPSLTTGWGGSILSSFLSGTLGAGLIPGLDASKIISGVLSGSLIPNLNASIINAGTFATGLIPGLDAAKIVSGVLSGSLIPNLAASIITSGTFGTGLIPGMDASKIISGAFGQSLIPSLTSTWGGTIANANVIGKVSADIGTDISQLISAVTTGAGNATIPGTLANLQSQLNGITSLLGYQPAADPPANSTSGIALTQAAFTAMRAATRPTFLALADSTGDVTFPFPLVGTSATTIPVTQAVPAIGSIGTTDGGVAGTDPTTWPLKKSISFCGSKSGTINAMYLTINRVNVTTGATTWVHTSPNIVASVPSAMNRVYYNMANVVDYVPVGQNEYYQIELRIYGPGTYNLVGIPNSWAPANAVGFPTHVGATRTPPNLYSVTSSSGATAKNPSWTLTTVTNDNCIIVDAVAYSTTSNITAMTATFGGVAMTQKKFQAFNTFATDAQSGVVVQFELHNAAFAAFTAGAKTVVITTTGGGTSGTQCAVQAQATSYQNISAVDAGTATTGNSASPAQTVTGLTANSPVILHSLLSNSVDNWTAGNQNIIANINGVTTTEPFLVQDQFAYATSIPFTGTLASGTGKWGASVVQLTSTLANLVAPVGGVAAPGFTPSSNLPWFMFGGAAGVSGAAVATHQPTLQTFTSSGVYHRKSWAKFYDIITCSGAGGGANGSSLVGGYPGAAGIWNTETVTAADVAGDANWDVIVGNGGFGGSGGTSAGASGFAGGDSYVDIDGYGTAAYTPGGIGGTTNNGTVAGSPGGGPGDITYNDEPYYGGNGGGSAQASGSQAGGSGAGGNAVFSGNNIYGGNGGDGIVYILARQ